MSGVSDCLNEARSRQARLLYHHKRAVLAPQKAYDNNEGNSSESDRLAGSQHVAAQQRLNG
jgi:hypothetical protein